MQVSKNLPETQGQRQQESQGMQGCGHVVAEKFGIAEDVSGTRVVEEIPDGEGNDRDEQGKNAAPCRRRVSLARTAGAAVPTLPFRRGNKSITSHATKAHGVKIAVSFASAARENQSAVASLRSSK